MQSVSAPFTAATAATYRKPVPKFEVQWDGANWTDETTNVMAFRLAQQIEIPGIDLTPLGTTDAGTVTLRNTSYRYSAWHSGGDSAIRTYLSGDWGVTGIKARLSMGFWVDTDTDGDYDEVQYCRVFTGYLYNISEAPQAKTVTLSLRDNAWLLYQKRLSTALYANYRLDTLLYTMADAGGWDVANDWTADTSPFTVPAAWLDDDAALQEMQQAAASVAGRLWCDANGELRYEEASHWLGHSSVSWHFDGGDLMELPPVLNPESLASSVIVEYASRVSGASRVLYTLDETRTIRPTATTTIDIRLTQPAAEVFELKADTDYWFDNGAGLPMNSKITIGTITYCAQRITIPITNTHATMPAVLRFLQVRGRPIEGGPQEEVETVIDASPIVPRVRSVRGNFYLQSRTQAAYLSALLAGRHDSLIPLWHIRSAPGVPQLELGDRVGVYDGRAVSAEREGFVLSIESRFAVPTSGTATEPIFAQDIRVMDATPLFVSATYFQIGVSALGSAVSWY